MSTPCSRTPYWLASYGVWSPRGVDWVGRDRASCLKEEVDHGLGEARGDRQGLSLLYECAVQRFHAILRPDTGRLLVGPPPSSFDNPQQLLWRLGKIAVQLVRRGGLACNTSGQLAGTISLLPRGLAPAECFSMAPTRTNGRCRCCALLAW